MLTRFSSLVRHCAIAVAVTLLGLPAAAAPCGTLVIPNGIGQGNPSAMASLNPLIDDSMSSLQVRLLLYRPLVWIGQSDGFDRDRSLAQSVEARDGNTVFRVAIKPWQWSDGQKITADDVVFCWELIQRLGAVFAYAGQGGVPEKIAFVRDVDAAHVDIGLKAPVNPEWFTLNGLSSLYALPRHAWGNPDRANLWQHQNDPAFFRVVDGPFLLDSFRLDQYAVFTPNPLYGGHQSQVARLVVDFLEGGSALHAAQAGEVDMAYVPPALWSRVRRTPGFHFTALPAPFGFRSMIFNLHNDRVAFFRDARVRQALTDAADQQAMMRLVYRGFSLPSRVPVPVGNDEFASPAMRAGALPVRDDPALAAQLLDASGWRIGEKGLRQKDGATLSFTALVPAEEADRIQEMQILQQDLRRLGVEMKLRLATVDQVGATLQGSDPHAWEAGLLGWTLTGVPDGAAMFATGGASNFGGYSDAAMDRLTADVASRPGREGVFAFADYAAAQQPWNFLPEGEFPLMVADGIEGVEDFTNRQGFWSPEYLRLTGPKACHAAHGGNPS